MEYFIAKTFAGLETELFKELHALGAKNCEKLSRAVASSMGTMCLSLRRVILAKGWGQDTDQTTSSALWGCFMLKRSR